MLIFLLGCAHFEEYVPPCYVIPIWSGYRERVLVAGVDPCERGLITDSRVAQPRVEGDTACRA